MPGTAASGGVSFGSGSVMTLTPEDAEAIAARVPRRRATSPRSSAPAPRWSTATATGCRIYIYGTTPAFLDVRDWDDLDEGEPFTDRDVRNGSKVCLLGQTLVARTVPGRIARRQGNPRQNVTVQGGRRAQPQGRQHDGHRPGRHPAGPVDDDQVPGRRHVARPTSTRAPPRPAIRQHDGQHAEPALSRPGRTALYPHAVRHRRRPTRRSRCASPTSIRSWSPAAVQRARSRRRSSRSPSCCTSGTASARASPTTSTSAT